MFTRRLPHPLRLAAGLWTCLLVPTLAPASAPATCPAAVDASFAPGGDYHTGALGGANEDAAAITVDSQGGYLVAGSGDDGSDFYTGMVLRRYLANGQVDTGFANAGVAGYLPVSPGNAAGQAVAVDPGSGSIYVAGWIDAGSAESPAVWKFSSGGGVVGGFGIAGIYTFPITGVSGQAQAAAVDGSGDLWVAGTMRTSGGADVMLLFRLDANGALQWSGTFSGAAGGTGPDRANDLVLDAGGNLLVAGESGDAGAYLHPVLWRIRPDGSLDSSFQGGGAALLTAPGCQSAAKVRVDGSGQIYVLCQTEGGGADAAVWRLDGSGQASAGFGSGGLQLLSATGSVEAEGLLPLAGGAVVVAGASGPVGSMLPTLWKLQSDGSPDTIFSPSGWVTQPGEIVGLQNDAYGVVANSGLAQAYVVAGSAQSNAVEDDEALWGFAEQCGGTPTPSASPTPAQTPSPAASPTACAGVPFIQAFAGDGVWGNGGDGASAALAQLGSPEALLVAPNGDVYIADAANNVVRKVSGGVISTVAGTGNPGNGPDGGLAAATDISGPDGLGMDAAGNLYIACYDTGVVRTVDGGGRIGTAAGNGSLASTGDLGPATSAGLDYPSALAVAPDGTLYIAEYVGGRVRKVSGGVISTYAGGGSGVAEGAPAAQASLGESEGLCLGPNGDLYISDSGESQIRRVDHATQLLYTVAGLRWEAGYDGEGGLATASRLGTPQQLAFDAYGDLLFVESDNHLLRMVDSGGHLRTLAGTGAYGYNGDNQAAVYAQLQGPQGLAIGPDGSVYIGDTDAYRVRWIGCPAGPAPVATASPTATPFPQACMVQVAVGNGLATADGALGSASRSNWPWSVAYAANGDLVYADSYRLRKLSRATGQVSTLAGDGLSGVSPNGTDALSAQLYAMDGNLALAPNGDIYFCQWAAATVNKWQASDHKVYVVAGLPLNGGNTGEGGPAVNAQISDPSGVAWGPDGNLYWTEHGNNVVRCLQMSDQSIHVVAGSFAPGAADGPALSASFKGPVGLAIDAAGNIYVADTDNGSIRKVAAGTRAVSTLATGFSSPMGPCLDGSGHLLVSEAWNHCVTQVDLVTHIPVLLLGNRGSSGDAGDGASAGPGTLLYGPHGVAWDVGSGDLAIADSYNNAVRVVKACYPPSTPTPSPTFTAMASGSPSPSATATPSPSVTASPSPSWTPTATPSASPTVTSSASATTVASYSATPSATPAVTSSFTRSGTPSASPTVTSSPTAVASYSATPSATPAVTSSFTRSGTPTATPSGSATAIASFTATPSATPSAQSAASVTASFTATPATPSPTPYTASLSTPTPSPLPADSPTISPTFTLSATPFVPAQLDRNIFRPGHGTPLRVSVKPPRPGRVSVRVFNLAGERVLELLDGDLPADRWTVLGWDGANHLGQAVGSGVYFVSVQGPGFSSLRKVVLIR